MKNILIGTGYIATAVGIGAGYVAHIIASMKAGAWGMLLIGALIPPYGIVHGTGVIWGWW